MAGDLGATAESTRFRLSRCIVLLLCVLGFSLAAAPVSFAQDKPASAAECQPCSAEEQKAEFDQMLELYRKEVEEARKYGYQCGSDPNYSDPGFGLHKIGNCADWAATTWRALVKKTWKCWRIVKVRARRKLIPFHHNFVYIVPKCGGKKIYFDPWRSGRPDTFSEDVFHYSDGFWGWWIHYPLVEHAPGDPPRDPWKDP